MANVQCPMPKSMFGEMLHLCPAYLISPQKPPRMQSLPLFRRIPSFLTSFEMKSLPDENHLLSAPLTCILGTMPFMFPFLITTAQLYSLLL